MVLARSLLMEAGMPDAGAGEIVRDRRVHAANSEAEVVRYDRAGKWYIEPRDRSFQRQHVTVKEAAEYALWMYRQAGGTIIYGVPGGGLFDREVHANA
jgi:hypothetical protein